jgi:hypothetical protein
MNNYLKIVNIHRSQRLNFLPDRWRAFKFTASPLNVIQRSEESAVDRLQDRSGFFAALSKNDKSERKLG